MESFIVTERCKTLRMLSREALRGRWGLAIKAFLVYYAMINVPVFLLTAFFPTVGWISGLYILFVEGPLVLGYSLFALNLFRNNEPKIEQMFYGFEKFSKAFRLLLMIGLLVILWSLPMIPGMLIVITVPWLFPILLLLMIPIVMACIRYSLAFFVLADHPEAGVMECISRSKALMAGNKMKYFLLQLSFIGWVLLAAVPSMLYQVFTIGSRQMVNMSINFDLSNTYVAPPEVTLITLLLTAGTAVVLAYTVTAYAAFYEMASGNLRPGYIPSTAEVVEGQPVEVVEGQQVEEQPVEGQQVEGQQDEEH